MKTVFHFMGRYIKSGLSGLFSLLLFSCQPTSVSIEINNQSYFQVLPAGTTLVLRQNLDIASNKARTYLQHGTLVKSADIDRYQPWCELEVKTLMASTQTIHADSFSIRKLVNERSGLMDGAGFGSISNTLEEFSTTLYLQSDSQPDVFRLICLHRKGTGMQTYLRLNDIQSALGDFAIINIK